MIRVRICNSLRIGIGSLSSLSTHQLKVRILYLMECNIRISSVTGRSPSSQRLFTLFSHHVGSRQQKDKNRQYDNILSDTNCTLLLSRSLPSNVQGQMPKGQNSLWLHISLAAGLDLGLCNID